MAAVGGLEVLSVRELVERSGLDLDLVGGRGGERRIIESVYTGDLDDPIPWMVRGSILLTTGRCFVEDTAAGERLIRALAAHDMAALGVAITPYIEEIHPRMVAAADAADLPLILVPPSTPFRAVSEYVHDLLSSRDLSRLRRSLSQQNQLLQALRDEGRPGLVTRLDLLTGMPTLLLGGDGAVLAISPGARPHEACIGELWQAYGEVVGDGRPRSVFTWRGLTVLFREVRTDGSAVGEVLLAYRHGDQGIAELPEAALTFAHRLLELELSTERAALHHRRAERDDLLADILAGRAGEDVPLRLAQHHLVRDEPWYVLVLAAAAPDGALPVGAAVTAERFLGRGGVPFLSARTGGCWVALLAPGAEEMSDVAAGLWAELAARGPAGAEAFALAHSAPVESVGGIGAALLEASCALELSRRDARDHDAPHAADHLGPLAVALMHADESHLQLLAGALCTPLREVDTARGSDLLLTVRTYLDLDRSASATADRLYLHRNALRKRLDRIEAATGVALDSTHGIGLAWASVIADALLAGRRLAAGLRGGTPA